MSEVSCDSLLMLHPIPCLLPPTPYPLSSLDIYRCLTGSGKKPLGKEAYMRFMVHATEGTLPAKMVEENAAKMWVDLTQRLGRTTLSEKNLFTIFTSLDLLGLSTIVI